MKNNQERGGGGLNREGGGGLINILPLKGGGRGGGLIRGSGLICERRGLIEDLR